MTDEALLNALDNLRKEFRLQNTQTENAVNNGFIAIRQEMRTGLDRLNDRMTNGLDAIAEKMLAHEREDHEAEKRIAKIEIEALVTKEATAKREAEAAEAVRRHSAIAGILAGVSVTSLWKVIDWWRG